MSHAMDRLSENATNCAVETCVKNIEETVDALNDYLFKIGVPAKCIPAEYWTTVSINGITYNGLQLAPAGVVGLVRRRQILKRKFST